MTSTNSASTSSAFVDEDTGRGIFISGQARTVPPLTRGGPNTISLRGGTAGGATSHVQPHGKSQENSDSIS